MEKGNLAKWLKREGDPVKPGDVIAEIETDKATMEVEAIDEGVLGKILVPEGSNDVAVNTPIATILADGEAPGPDGQPEIASVKPAAAPSVQAAAAVSATAPPKLQIPPEIDLPAGTEMATMTVREALRDAMAEEMRRDGDVFVMGEEVAEYQGAYKVTQGLLQADYRAWVCRARHRGGAGRAQARCGIHDLQLRHAGHGPFDQFRGQDALHVGGPGRPLDRVSRTERSGLAGRGPAQPGLHRLVLAHSGPQGGRPLYGGGCQGPAQGGDPRSQSDHVSGK
jgi:hypothetical protein